MKPVRLHIEPRHAYRLAAASRFLQGETLRLIRIGAPAILLFTAAPAGAHHLNKRFSVQPHPLVTVSNTSGTVTVRAWDREEIQVIADHSSDKVEVDATQTGNRVDLLTHTLTDSVAPEDMLSDYDITVPSDAELQIHSDSGNVAISSVLGDADVDTVGAGVDMSDTAGYIKVKTMGGSFKCVRCAGRLEVTSISGNVMLVDARSFRVHAETTNGNILFDGEFLPNGVYQLRNYSGVIEVRFSPGDSFALNARSLRGIVNNQANLTPPTHEQYQVPRFGHALFGSFNQGRAKVELSSFDGTINIYKRE